METIVDLPNNPYFCTLNFQPGEYIKVSTTLLEDAKRVNFLFKCDEEPTSDIGLFIAVDLEIDEVVICSKLSTGWGKIKKYYGLGVKQPNLEFAIQCTHDTYEISINGKEIDKYEHKTAWYNITHMVVCGDIIINKIIYIPVRQLIRTGDSPPPDYETVTQSDYGSIGIGIEPENKNEKVLSLYPKMIPYAPTTSEAPCDDNSPRSSYPTLVVHEHIKSASLTKFILGTLSLATTIFGIIYLIEWHLRNKLALERNNA